MARKEKYSEIGHAPPHVREIWHYLIREANHSGKKKHGHVLERGQILTTYDEIRDGLHWMVGWRKMRYSKSQCENAMKFLRRPGRNGSMIATRKTTRGLIITILNYNFYQNPKNYESHNESHNECHDERRNSPQTADTIDKNVKNEKNVKDTPQTPHKKIVDLYKNILSELPQPTEITDTLKKSIKARWREHPDLEWWEWYFNGIRDCPFLMGKKTDWCANLNWILGPKNMTKVLSGQYLEKNKESRLKSVGEKWLERQRKKSDS